VLSQVRILPGPPILSVFQVFMGYPAGSAGFAGLPATSN
jgi:hypothetical protein